MSSALWQKSQREGIQKPKVRGSSLRRQRDKARVGPRVIGLFAEASISGARPSTARASLMVKMPFDV